MAPSSARALIAASNQRNVGWSGRGLKGSQLMRISLGGFRVIVMRQALLRTGVLLCGGCARRVGLDDATDDCAIAVQASSTDERGRHERVRLACSGHLAVDGS